MRNLVLATILGATFLTIQAARSQAPQAPRADSAGQVAAATYEHLATAIIEIEKTENELVKSILIGHYTAAQNHLQSAARGGERRAAHLEAAAAEIANIANEGDKRIQAVRQRLAKAGHTHNTDIETKEDYLFVSSKEKKGLLALASKIGRAGADVKASDLEALGGELDALFSKAIAPE